MLSFGSHT